jgi:hypothetical protein
MKDSLVTQKLSIKIMYFVTTMMHMWNRVLGHEETMMVNVFITPVDMSKESYLEFFLS